MEITTVKVDGDELILAPVGDIQYGAQGCDVDKLSRHIAYGLEHNWWFLGMGDYLDHFSPSNKRALLEARAGTLYESANELIDEAVQNRVCELAYGPLYGSEGRWLGLIYGDHAWTYQDGKPADYHLAEELGAASLGYQTLLHVKVGKCPIPLRIFAKHGRGASVSSTGKTLDLERCVRSYEADIYLQGHSHLKYGVALDRFEHVTKRGKSYLVNRTKIAGVTGSFLNGIAANQRDSAGYPTGGYVEQGGYNPIPTGGLVITCKPVEEEYGWRWDMFVSA